MGRQGDKVRERIFSDRNACSWLRLILTEFQNFQNFVMAIIPRFTTPIPLVSGFSNRDSSPNRVIQKILKFCQLGYPPSRQTVLLGPPYRAWLSQA
jgi:hypothetical protein